MAAQPRIVTRREWGARFTIPSGRFVAPAARRFFVVHWPVMTTRDERAWCRDIEAMHRRQGWAAAPGYNYLVGQSGTIFEGCGRDVRGIHSPPRNTDGWGVCVLQPSTAQGRPTAPVSQAARNATRALYDWLGSVAGRRLGMSWHGQHWATACPGPDLTAWVRAGMPGAPAPAPTPQPQEDGQMMASGLAWNDTLHVFLVGPARGTVWLSHQAANQNTWSGGQAGRAPAGFRRLVDAPQGRTIRSITAERDSRGILTLWINLDDFSTLYMWQRRGELGWQSRRLFAPRP